MISKRNNKEYKMDTINGVKLKYGTTNKANPQVLYITGRTWVRPMNKMNYSDSLDRIKNRMERRILNRLKTLNCFDTKYIFNFDLTPQNMKSGVSKFMTFNIFLKQNKFEVKELKSIKPVLNVAILPLIEEMTNDFNEDYFELHINKPNTNGKEKKGEAN